MVAHKADLRTAADGYRCFLRGEETYEADAAGIEFATVMARLDRWLKGQG